MKLKWDDRSAEQDLGQDRPPTAAVLVVRLYISGPMSGIEEHNFPAFRAAADLLRSRGYDVEDPAEKGIIPGWTWGQYMRYDIVKLMECDGVALLSGWTKSRGAQLEVVVAEGLDIPVRAVEFWA